MNKQELFGKLRENHQLFIDAILLMDEAIYYSAKEGKWNAGQTLDHLQRSVSTLDLAMQLPRQLFAWLFGKANRPSNTYDALVTKYRAKLAAGGKAHGRYLPGKVGYENRKQKTEKLQKAVEGICKKAESYAETQLDEYILPHPLLGKITIREMLYFTAYHAEHHRLLLTPLESVS